MNPFDEQHNLAFQSPDVIKKEQEKLLNQQIRYCRKNSQFYREKLANLPDKDFTIEDLAQFPLTTKSDLHENIDRFVAVPQKDIADIVFTSGTTGKPCKIVYSLRDMHRLAYNEAVCFHAAGITPEDTALITCTLDRCFIAGLAYCLGTVKLGGAIIRNGLNTIESHAEIIRNNRVTALVGVPSFLVKLGDYLSFRGIDSSSIRHIICIGEPLHTSDMSRTPLAQRLENYWPGAAYSTYSSSEIVTSFAECSQRFGGHAAPDLCIVEIVDDAGNVLPPGEIGEVVITPLQLEGTPLIRFRTGDISFLMDSPCACGRNTPRLGPILSRKSQMLKCKGTTLFPATFFNVLDQIDGIDNYYMEVSGNACSDIIDLFISFKHGDMDSLDVKKKLAANTRVNVNLHTVSCEEARNKIFGLTRKPLRFFDLRNKE